MIRLVIVPGTDGTGRLVANFAQAISDLRPLVISYPKDSPQDYVRLATSAETQLPKDEPFCLLGESFGGPVAILLARHQGCVGLILSASFSRYSSPVRMMEPLAGIISPKLLPSRLLSWFLLGKWSSVKLRSELAAALASSSDAILGQRLKAALRVDVSDEVRNLKLPLLYLQATEDRIVPKITGTELVNTAAKAKLAQIEGPHMLLQAVPQLCAEEVRHFVANL